MARPKGTGGRSQYDRFRKYMSTKKRLSGQSNRFTRRSKPGAFDTGRRNKYTKKRSF